MCNDTEKPDLAKEVFGDDDMVRFRVIEKLSGDSLLVETINDPDDILMNCFISDFSIYDVSSTRLYDISAVCDKGRAMLDIVKNRENLNFKTARIVW